MVIGIGVDVVETDRVRRSCRHRHFVEGIFTSKEQKQFDSTLTRAASDFAAKEATAKALGTGFSEGVEAIQIEVLRSSNGAPYIELSGEAKDRAEALGITQVNVSISNTESITTAFVVCTND
ncbi:holo-ACP synthase [Eubacterium xylanophilum]|uniref:holo-ACP synthase n=1 Tax=Eubacterium xylanophilum TaxID=39497 RepID=UPI000478C7ED|nr:holo-ACP synthase [Eubacterium xylanophilum]MCR5796816.1 holo-ACP synthase [Eubacterium sp.]